MCAVMPFKIRYTETDMVDVVHRSSYCATTDRLVNSRIVGQMAAAEEPVA